MNQQFNWDQFEAVGNAQPKQQAGQQQQQGEQQFDWNQYEKVKEPGQEESKGQWATRQVARSGTRAGETALGMAGNMFQAGKMLPKPPKIFDREPNFIQKAGRGLLEKLPTTEDLRKFTQSYFGDYTEPQNEYEKMGDEFTQDVTNLLLPGGKVKNALYVATGGQIVKQGMDKLGFSDEAQDTGKLGTMFVMSMINPKGIENLYKQRYSDAGKLLPNKEIGAKNLENTLDLLERNLSKGIPETTKTKVLGDVHALKAKIRDGKINSQELWQAKKDINKKMGDPEFLEYAENLYPKLTTRMNAILKKSPELPRDFKRALIEGDQAYGALHQSQNASRFLKKLHPGKSVIGILAGTAIHSPEYLPHAATGALAGAGVLKGYELMKRVNANPTMRKYYLNMLKAAAEKNSANAAMYMDKLEKELEKK